MKILALLQNLCLNYKVVPALVGASPSSSQARLLTWIRIMSTLDCPRCPCLSLHSAFYLQ
ncbi:hypothetical protein LEMLEM_LOCUS25669 [Lemmus lemmus]